MAATTINGTVGTDATLQQGPNGPWSRFRLAETVRGKDGQSETAWWTVVTFGTTAENVSKSVRSGMPVRVMGQPQMARPYVPTSGPNAGQTVC